ncbi:hypothetical protein GUJ93_ZPchr0002g23147 [Zizania palustris]|uniref:F-box domain-containing protein n=1 Tax=Zizania palustris TaxID=103762 RepID=A0A8J5RU40_ZIZPA|nr:hypothetical protein GUJ93_ZPchr0002g23147 [Zizania palustris]
MVTAESRIQRRDKLKRASRKVVAARAGTATTVKDVSDHILEVILLRLESPVCLVRAAAACTRWRRVIADASFLRSFRLLHGKTRRVAGHYHTVDPSFGPPSAGVAMGNVFVPSPPHNGIDARFFSLDFLPDYDESWELADSRGSLLLLSKKRKPIGWWEAAAPRRFFPDLVVCEPLTRRCQGIVSPVYLRRHQCLGVFLLDGDGDEAGGRIGMSNFRVICALHDHEWQHELAVPMACVFTSGSNGGWRVVQSTAAVDLPERFDSISFAGHANGRLYWGIEDEDGGAMLVLDESTHEFSLAMFPGTVGASYDKWTFRVIAGDDGALRVVRVISKDLKVFAQLAGSGEWVLEKLVNLPEVTRALPGRKETFFLQGAEIVAASAAYVLVTPKEKRWLFSVELETLQVERMHERNRYAGAAYSYELPWPPALEACSTGHSTGRQRRH